jgi:hypothetical protein
MRKFIVPLLLFILFAQSTFAQDVKNDWGKWKYLLGEWKGEGNGQPGQGSGSFSFRNELDGNVLIRKNLAEFPATANRPAARHEDLMIVYKNADGNPSQAIYFDNESHVIHYDITYPENKIVLTSMASASGPRFRLVYEKIEESLVNIRFEMAMPNAPDDFKLYLEGKSHKVN